MAATNTENITVQIELVVKLGLKPMAGRGRRSQTNMIEVMVRDYCGHKSHAMPRQGRFFCDYTRSG